MFTTIKKSLLAFVLVLGVLATGTSQSDQVVFAEQWNDTMPETPLYPGLTWSSLGRSKEDIRINIDGDSISLSGERFEALEKFPLSLPQEVQAFYSNGQLAQSGWVSYDAFDGPDGIHFVYYHEAGAYLSVELLNCSSDPSSICLNVWKSEQVSPNATASAAASVQEKVDAAATFSKKSPSNGATGQDPTSTVLIWEAYSPTPDKYSYCVKEGSACANNDGDYTCSNILQTKDGLSFEINCKENSPLNFTRSAPN